MSRLLHEAAVRQRAVELDNVREDERYHPNAGRRARRVGLTDAVHHHRRRPNAAAKVVHVLRLAAMGAVAQLGLLGVHRLGPHASPLAARRHP